MVRIYGIRNCDNCRRSLAWLTDHGIEHEFIDIRSDGIGRDELRRWQKKVGWEELLNKRSVTWRKIPAVDREGLDAAAAGQLIEEHPTVMRRPLLEAGKDVLLGFDPDAYARLFRQR